MKTKNVTVISSITFFLTLVLTIIYSLSMASTSTANKAGSPADFVTVFPYMALGFISLLMFLLGYLIKEKDRSVQLRIMEVKDILTANNSEMHTTFNTVFERQRKSEEKISFHSTEIATIQTTCRLVQKQCPMNVHNKSAKAEGELSE